MFNESKITLHGEKVSLGFARLKNREILWINFRECLPGSDLVRYKLS